MSVKDLPLDERPREKLLKHGAAALSDAELLALLLRTGIAGKGVMQMAHELLQIRTPTASSTLGGTLDDRLGNTFGNTHGFGGIGGLLSASANDLKAVKGLGPAKRAEIIAVLELARRAVAQQLQEREVLPDLPAVQQFLQLHLGRHQHEVFAVLFLDLKNKLLAFEELFRGTLSHTNVYPREVVLRALHHQASAVVFAHNHPSGDANPSEGDRVMTQTLKAALGLVDVRVLDHIVVAAGQCISMDGLGML